MDIGRGKSCSEGVAVCEKCISGRAVGKVSMRWVWEEEVNLECKFQVLAGGLSTCYSRRGLGYVI